MALSGGLLFATTYPGQGDLPTGCSSPDIGQAWSACIRAEREMAAMGITLD